MSTASLDLEPGPAAVGSLVGLAGLLFLLVPVVGSVPVAGRAIPLVVLSAATLAVGFALGALVFARRGRRLFAIAHGVFGAAWTLLVAGPLLGSEPLFYAGVVVLLAGCGFLASESR
ncbi:hypothetical protein [Haloarcula litorea]|uniref:hypothetical protein n=1 Tax=Haloarcula litorea TaxID=3032579 RepID=UPI0023E8DD6C|nr:hypothetical protein [Halomicroarcula sp. GDY20]